MTYDITQALERHRKVLAERAPNCQVHTLFALSEGRAQLYSWAYDGKHTLDVADRIEETS